jgi:hypothetical protein
VEAHMSDPSERYSREREQRVALERLLEKSSLTEFEKFRNFPVYTPRFNLARFLSHYELFKRVCELPGVIVDLGVYRGASLMTWAKLCEIFCPTDVKKVVCGFDTFEGFPSLSTHDGPVDILQDKTVGGYSGGVGIEKELALAIEAMDVDRHIRDVERTTLIKGDVRETIPQFIEDCGNGLRIALMNLDVDLYEPTRVALEHFMPRMVRGGIVILDEYAVKTFGGESKAVDEWFLKNRGGRPALQKFTWHSNPSAYIVVDW